MLLDDEPDEVELDVELEEEPESDELLEELSPLLLLALELDDLDEARLSVREKPLPLKTTPTLPNSLRSRPLHLGHAVSASSLNA